MNNICNEQRLQVFHKFALIFRAQSKHSVPYISHKLSRNPHEKSTYMTREYIHPSHLQNRSSKRDSANISHIKMHLIIQIIPQIAGLKSLERYIPNPIDDE